ncbi:MAG: hypothetical protein ACK4UO_17595 [Pseudolabrys sp.]
MGLMLGIAGCASTGNPNRLIEVDSEMQDLRAVQLDMASAYRDAVLADKLGSARAIRNEIIAQRMYAIDVQYSQYEAALTHESQKVGFASLTTAEGLSTAATLATPPLTKTILSGLTTAVVATKGHYGSEVLLALTMRTIQKQMRASRNVISEHINRRMAQSITDYPLSAALSDVEEYYRAGTLTTGVIDTSTTVGEAEKRTEERKQAITLLTLSARPAAVLPDSKTPIVPPVQTPILHETGIGRFEQRLLPVHLAQLQGALCLKSTGDPEVDLAQMRAAALKHMEEAKIPKDKTVPNGITNSDRIRILRAKKTCP